MRLKLVVVVQAIVILALAGLLWWQHPSLENTPALHYDDGLLSPRVYGGILEPKSYLIINFVPLKKELQKYIEDRNIEMSIYVVNLRNGASMSLGAYKPFPPASLSKVPIAILMMRKVEEGKLSLDTPIEIYASDRINSSSILYNTSAKTLPLSTLLQEMLQQSDNTAFKVLLRYLEKNDEKLLNDYWDYFSTDTTPEPEQEHRGEVITARSVYNVFLSLYLSTVLEPEHSEYILHLLTDTVFDIKKVAQIPSDVRIAHKYGVREEDPVKVFHDCGIMYIQETRIFYCVMTNGMGQKEAVGHIAFAVNGIYNYVLEDTIQLNVIFIY